MNDRAELRDVLYAALAVCCPEIQFAADKSLVSQGLGSLAATRFALEAEVNWGVSIPVAMLGAGLTLDEIIAKSDRRAVSAEVPPVSVRPVDSRDGVPLLPLQQAYLVTSDAEYSGDPVGCHMYREFELGGVLALDLVESWERLVAHHEILRARLTEMGTLHIGPSVGVEIISVAEREHDAAVRARRAQWQMRCARGPNALVAAAAVVSPRRATLHLSIDGLLTDGHGLLLLVEQWRALARDRAAPIGTSSLTLADCVSLLSQGHSARDLQYWCDVLGQAPDGPFADHVREAIAARRGGDSASRPASRRALAGRLSELEWQRCLQRAVKLGISPTSLVFAVFAEVILETSGNPGASFVLTTSERPRLPADVRYLVGPFTSSMVVPVEVEAGESFDTLAVRVHRDTWRHLQHNAVPAVVALRAAAACSVGKGLPVVFTSLLGLMGEEGPASCFALRPNHAVSQTSGVALDHQMWSDDGELVIHWDIADSLLPPFAAEMCLSRMITRLRAIGVASESGSGLNLLQQAYLVSDGIGSAGAVGGGRSATFSFAAEGVDAAAVADAWEDIVATHAALRTVVAADGTTDVLDRSIRPDVGVTAVELSEREDRRGLLDRAMGQLPYPSGRWPLHQVHVLVDSSRSCSVHLCFDLLVLDGKSIHQIVALLAQRMVRLAGGVEMRATLRRPSPSPPIAEPSVCAGYWAAKMEAILPGPEVRPSKQQPRQWRRLVTRIEGFEAFADACHRHGTAPDVVIVAALARAFRPEVKRSFTIPVVWWRPEDDQRRPSEMSQMAWVVQAGGDVGASSGEAPFATTVREFAQSIQRDIAHGGISGLARLGARVMRDRRASDSAPLSLPVVYTSLVEWGCMPSGMAASLRWQTMTPDISLDAVALAVNDTLVLAWDVVEGDFSEGVVERVFDRYSANVERAVQDPAWALDINDADVERRKVLFDWNDTKRAFPAHGPTHLAFEAAAAARPEDIAVRWRGGSWTFARLNEGANRIARKLRELGVGRERKVAIAIDRGPEMIASTLGVLKAGGVYVPIEPSQPKERADRMMQIADCSIVLTSSSTKSWVLPSKVVRVAVDELPGGARDAENLDVANDVDSTAYIIFTSGSTGEPKGVAVAHRALHNLLHWCKGYGFGPGDVGLCVTSLGFDLSVFDIIGLLGFGAGIYVADAVEQRDPSLLAEVLAKQPITFWNSAPTTLAHMRPYFADLVGKPEARRLRLIFLSGDYTPLSLPPELFATFPKARLVSLGGATEATVWSNFFEVTKVDPSWRSIPYGRPIDNARYYILDADRTPCPVGTEGDLYIAGEVLSLGYYNRPEFSSERFIRDPFVSDPAARMYFTGDRAMFFKDGVISFQGRSDTQVKIRGFRVELQEIERAVLQYPEIADAVVIAQRDPSGDPKLVAYVLAEKEPDGREVQAFVGARLPSYMVPNFVHAMKQFPATSNGKLDRAGFPWPLPDGNSAKSKVESSNSTLEELMEELQGLFLRFLGKTIHLDEDIWSHGATSFTMVQISGALRSSRGVRLPVTALVENPTVRGMAKSVVAKLKEAVPSPAVLQAGMHAAEPVDTNEHHRQVQSSAPSASSVTRTSASTVDLLDAAAKSAFLASGANRRVDLDDAAGIRLPLPQLPPEWNKWRATQRNFNAERIPLARLAALLGLLAPSTVEGLARHLFPSAGDTYAVQTYLWVRDGRVDGVLGGYYWFDGKSGALIRIGSATALDRSVHFFYNRPIFDAAAAAVFFVGEHRGIAPLYGEEARRFLLLEAGYMGQLLLLGQCNVGLGLCPIGTFHTRPVEAALQLSDSHEVLHSFLLGGVHHEAGGPDVQPPLTIGRRSQPIPATVVREIAIVGHAGRYPGAESPEALWKLLRDGKSALRPAPPRRGLDGAAAAMIGGFLDDIESFDPTPFSIAPSEARSIDPQARLLLEVVWECLERAGHGPASLQNAGERVGVFVGHLWQDYRQVGADQPEDEPALIAGVGSELANRISSAFGFTGPSIAVDTSCSSSVTALHLAVSAMERGECESALVCGVNLIAHPSHARVLLGLNLVAERAPVGAYDQDTAGWAVGEGAGALLLRRTRADVDNGDNVLAIVSGSHLEHIGPRARFGTPSSQSVVAAMRAAIAGAGLHHEDIDYVECAASGAMISDAAEWQALSEVFPSGVLVGTLKPNIGHLEAASGLSQIAKALLQIEHRELAPTRLTARVSALIDPGAGPLRIVESVTPFRSTGKPTRILINAVGATGSLAQVILAAPAPARSRAVARGPSVLLISAPSRVQLDELAGRYIETLEARCGGDWADTCATAQMSRAGWRFRLAIDASGREESLQILRSFVGGRAVVGARVSEADPSYFGRESRAREWRRALEDWLAGYAVDWTPFWTGTPRRVRLPTYPFARQQIWAATGVRPSPVAVDAGRWLEAVRSAYGRAAEIPLAELDPRVPLERYGLSSRIATQVVADLNRRLGAAHLPATLLYEHRDLASVAGAVAAVAAGHGSPVERDTMGATQPKSTSRALEPLAPAPTRARGQAVAIVGLAGRFPGAPDVDTFWRRLLAGEDLVAGPPSTRLEPEWPAGVLCGGFLSDVAAFDPFLFGITPDDAARMDPQERLFLEVVWSALEDACYPPTRIKTDFSGEVGVFAGVMHNEYPLLGVELSTPGHQVDAGATPAGVANRISYHFDLTGPSLVVDTMCSSSLTALQLAVEALRSGRIRMAIVGGTNLSLHPNKFVQQARLKMTSSDQRCRAFGAGGDGFVPGEGVGAVILRLLDDAERAGDRIHGVIRGIAVNHGGKVNGFTVPNPRAQSQVIAAALADGGVAPETISYVEAHGTGTALGDPIEARALSAALNLPGTGQVLALGSVKSNIGHTEAAAGIAGLTKVLLQMRHKTLLPSLHSAVPNPDIDWTSLRVVQTPERWKPRKEAERDVWRAGVSSFGAGGVNAHVVVEAYSGALDPVREEAGPHVLVLSAATPEALTAAARSLATFLVQSSEDSCCLADVAGTLQMGREALRERWSAVSRDRREAVHQLQTFADGGEVGYRGRARPGAAPVSAEADRRAIAASWVKGAEVDWAALHPQRRRMIALPSYSFSHMRCWIDDSLRKVVLSPGVVRASTEAGPSKSVAAGLADQLGMAERVWRPAPLTPDVGTNGAQIPDVLVLCTPGTAQLGRELAAALGSNRARAVDEGQWEISERRVGAVVLLGDLDPSPRDDNWRRPFEVCRALARRSALNPVHIFQVVSGMHPPSTVGPASSGALLAGLVHGLAAERSGVTTTVLDVGPIDVESQGSRADCADKIASELRHRTPGDVCVTPLGRMVPSWEEMRSAGPAWAPRSDALYLVTGGTRGIGSRLAAELVRRGARRLALVGRRRSVASDALVRGLREAGAVVQVHYDRVEDGDALNAWLQAVEADLGAVVGIFHCAGLPSPVGGSLLDIELGDIAAVAAPKVDGLAALLSTVRRSPPEIVVAFSSISAVVHAVGVGVGDYAAANSAMEYMADQQRRRGYPMIRTIAWPVWDSSEANTASRAIMRRHSLPALSDDQAFSLLWSMSTMPGSGRYAAVDSALLVPPPAVIASPPASVQEAKPGAASSTAGGSDWLAALIAARIGMPVERLDRSATFDELGIESVMLGRLVEDIEARVGRPIAPSLVIEHPTVEELSVAIGDVGAASTPVRAPGEGSNEVNGASLAGGGRSEAGRAVAIVGMAVRFPGAPNTLAFWDLLARGGCAVGEVPRGRWDVDALFDAEGHAGKSISRWGGFLDGIENFDPDWFHMSEDEARHADPAIRLFLEGAEACIRDSGRQPAEIRQQRVGVFVGARMADYRLRVGRSGDGAGAGLGGGQNFIAAWVAHHFDLRGPNMVIDSACSSALTAVHLAFQSILSGESELALAGGVDVLLDEAVYVQFTAARALSPSGRCRTFDKAADGFVPGEGCGVFLLKRLDKALQDGDRILAVVEGSAVNNDGHTMGLTTPSPTAQRDVVTTALARAGRSPREIGFVEAHGTATMIGDPIELRALADVFKKESEDIGFCAIGSVKTNIGHLLSAAGAAGLAKAILAVERGVIPPTLFCETPNPRFDLARSPFFITHTACPWAPRGARVAGVSAFGLGGANAHVVVSQAPEHAPRRRALPEPQFRRRRLWLDRVGAGDVGEPGETLSLLDLSFVEPDPPAALRSSSPAQASPNTPMSGRNHSL